LLLELKKALEGCVGLNIKAVSSTNPVEVCSILWWCSTHTIHKNHFKRKRSQQPAKGDFCSIGIYRPPSVLEVLYMHYINSMCYNLSKMSILVVAHAGFSID
jgi:hypothetical protein